MNQYVFEEERPVVDTKCGKIRGIAYGGVNIFMGIDYAKAKRFQMPVEIEPWEGIKNAYQHGPISKQVLKLKPFYTYRGLHMLEEESEDCQNLNIWAPKGGAEKKPVFVWIHGGGFFGGNAFEEYSFEGANLARHGDIIFVSINHRLNILGHLNLDQYGEEFKDSPNVGIADLVVAMKWINENIAAFGGDPENVTICGHSGGGGKVQCLFQLKDAAPYFQRGIVLSGARSDEAYHLDDGTASRETAKKMMDYLGINKDNIQKVKGFVITHGHEDHIGALPYVLRELNLPIYATKLTMGIIEKKLTEHNLLRSTRRKVVRHGQSINLGQFRIEFIKTNHSIQDAAALAIYSPAGIVVHTGDFKVDYTPVYGDAIDLQRFAEIGKKGVLALMSDSTNAE